MRSKSPISQNKENISEQTSQVSMRTTVACNYRPFTLPSLDAFSIFNS